MLSHIFRLEPLPYGTTALNLLEWSNFVGWRLKPIKASGPKTWIVGSDSQPKDSFMQYNGHPLIVKLLPPKNSPVNTAVLAGPKPGKFQIEKPNNRDLLQTNDPWANYNPSMTNATTPNLTAPREVAGPTRKKFQEQDAKMQVLEQQIASLRQDTQQGIDQLKHDQDVSHKQLASAMQSMKQEIDTSVAKAMKNQSTQLEGTLNELKELFLKKNDKPDNKRPAERADMEY